MVRKLRWLPFGLLAMAPSLFASAALPPYFTPPGGFRVEDVAEEEWGEAIVPLSGDEATPTLRRGRHWNAIAVLQGVPEETRDRELMTPIAAALARGGWSVAFDSGVHPLSASFRYQSGGREAWLYIWFFGATDLRFDLVEVGPQPLRFSLKKPAATPEPIDPEGGDFPWLTPLPGSSGREAEAVAQPLYLPMAGSDELQLVGEGYLRRFYVRPGTSNIQFVTVYGEALKSAGWEVVSVGQGPNMSDSYVVARYARDGRDIWVKLQHGAGEYAFLAADVGGHDLAAALAAECRVTLRGVVFDFDKATLRPGSEAELARAAAALSGRPELLLEVEGHTDAVGDDAYNLRLSQARAQAVASWLVAHGVAPARLSAKGYGETRPIASNDDAQGRAQNRRVDLACRR